MSVPSLSCTAFPVIQAGRHPQLHFRGLLELYACYGLPGCSPTKKWAWLRGFDPSGRSKNFRQDRSSATMSTDDYMGGSFLHW
jgi:hypothetical protein